MEGRRRERPWQGHAFETVRAASCQSVQWRHSFLLLSDPPVPARVPLLLRTSSSNTAPKMEFSSFHVCLLEARLEEKEKMSILTPCCLRGPVFDIDVRALVSRPACPLFHPPYPPPGSCLRVVFMFRFFFPSFSQIIPVYASEDQSFRCTLRIVPQINRESCRLILQINPRFFPLHPPMVRRFPRAQNDIVFGGSGCMYYSCNQADRESCSLAKGYCFQMGDSMPCCVRAISASYG